MKRFSILFSLILIFACFSVSKLSAQAMTYEECVPSYSLYCEENVIKGESVDYKISSVEDNKIIGNIEYQIEGAIGKEYTFYIPLCCSHNEIPQYDVKLNGSSVATEFMYGELVSHYRSDNSMNNAIERSSVGKIDETIEGTLYKFLADKKTLSVSFSLSEKQSVIFQAEGMTQSSSGVNGYSYTINTEIGKEYTMFVTKGDLSNIEATTEYDKESKKCKEYIDENYLPYEELFSQAEMPIELFYAKMSKLLEKKSMVNYHDFFWQQGYSLNFYRFSLVLEQPTTITYSEKTSVQTRTTFEPSIYIFERKKSAEYSTVYSIEITDEFPYVIEDNVGLDKTGNIYKATSSQDSFYCVYSSEQKPVSKYDNENPNRTWLIVGISVGSALLVGSVILIIVLKKKGC